ncbi:Hypothetical protein CINCED_3A003655 [Cinara cedri]|uniref:Uncharacterized protein n=1 Tax=Cinara cedri TaxID=506608 RepID=A0A5E4NJ81_9HEMI|nr:Hypothetical protein CINCED_3A003655 [Cinara cedri]
MAADHIVLEIASLIWPSMYKRINTMTIKYVHNASATNKGENTIHISYDPGAVDVKAISSNRRAKKTVKTNRARR